MLCICPIAQKQQKAVVVLCTDLFKKPEVGINPHFFKSQIMKTFSATSYPFDILLSCNTTTPPFPLLKDRYGMEIMYCLTPNHGRSFVVSPDYNGRCIVSKGNGLGYSTKSFINTGEFGFDTWGLLLVKDAVRDFNTGKEIAELGVKTNRMEYVLEIDHNIILNGKTVKPCLLQYSVESPYRINDSPFMSRQMIEKEISKWKNNFVTEYDDYYLIAAEVMIRNLFILHSNGVLHNAIQAKNYTWALELLDFELCHTPRFPYDTEDDIRHVKTLFSREVIQTYEIVNYIAAIIGEDIDFCKIELVLSKYGFDLDSLNKISIIKN